MVNTDIITMKRTNQFVQTAMGGHKRHRTTPSDPRRRSSTDRPIERPTAASSSPPWDIVDDSESLESDSAPSDDSRAAGSSPPWQVVDESDSESHSEHSESASSAVTTQDNVTTPAAQTSGGQDPEPANMHLLKALIELHVNRVLERNKGSLVLALIDQVITGKTEQESAFLFTNLIRSRAKIDLAFHQCNVRVSK